MSRRWTCLGLAFAWSTSLALLTAFAEAGEEGGKELMADHELAAWRHPTGDWLEAGDAEIDPKNPKRLVARPGTGVWINGPSGKTSNLLTSEEFGDAEVHLEFLVPRGSNSGVKLEGLYEIQIADSFGAREVTASHCGGIYPRAEMKPKYHHIDKGIPPRTNAAKPAGQWQTLELTFHAPRLDAGGRKVANARFVKVVLNGQVIHDDVEVASPTGDAWKTKEPPAGPLMLQADHGPVAFRNVRVRPLKRP